MFLPEDGKITWLFRDSSGEPDVMAIRRNSREYVIYKGAKAIFRAPRLEGWSAKAAEIESRGYVLEDVARLRGLLPSEWGSIKAKLEKRISRSSFFVSLNMFFSFLKWLPYAALAVSAAVAVYYHQLCEKLPRKDQILPEIYKNPVQVKVNRSPFSASAGGIQYTITPLYSYELYGLVVSYHDSTEWWDIYHRQWKDNLNVRDVGVVWGENIENESYLSTDFKSGSFTLYWRRKDGVKGDVPLLKSDCASNNHLIVNDVVISQKIMSVRRGDQIYIKGYLSEYSHSGETFKRGTSISRADRGNHACETVFVQDFRILKEANSLMRRRFKSAFFAFAISGIAVFIMLASSLFENMYHRRKS